MPHSIMARVTLVLFVGILIAQVFGTWLWISQLKASEHNRLIEVSQTMGSRIGQTVQFFKKLPDQYRHIVLDQLRDMGGTRFFVSVNEQHIALQTIPQTEFSQLVREQMSSSIVAQMGQARGLDIQFVDFDDLKILSGSNLMVDLPPKWTRFALMEPSDSSPVAVVQLPVANEWIYLAAVIPEGHMLNGVTWLNTERLLSIGLVSLTVLLLTLLLVRWVVRPLRLLARQAEAIGKGRNPRHMREQGSSEMIATIRAFNAMVGRIQKFMGDRERLFAAISHDLKTPLTRAR
ncbi:MAG: HAMP domain-containing protein, partial [Oceanospirillaceae bacterium]|nr:HAMP domain-containing protein [Oceanospirillaceae bacterium]